MSKGCILWWQSERFRTWRFLWNWFCTAYTLWWKILQPLRRKRYQKKQNILSIKKLVLWFWTCIYFLVLSDRVFYSDSSDSHGSGQFVHFTGFFYRLKLKNPKTAGLKSWNWDMESDLFQVYMKDHVLKHTRMPQYTTKSERRRAHATWKKHNSEC